ncbi:MAG: iron-containing alcohol dehydrogenase [Candidatus Margulisiibacteriota bacterium]|nr:iron-containing alcohol dehydrogenase [Candidatus Margulisiibacteriota bacterium]
MSFKFKVSTNLRYGVSESEKVGEEIRALGFSKPGVIIDQGVFEHLQTNKVLESIKNADLSFEVFKNDAVEPDYDHLDEFKKNFSGKEFDCLVGVGGGSVLDLTKAMATLITNPGPALDYKGFPDLKNRPLPVIAIPTTAGTGSEVTYNAVFTDSSIKKKLGINSELNYPVLAIIDPLFTVNCPKSVTVSSGCDALVHTLESYVHRNNTPLSRMLSKEAFSLLFNSLNKVLDNPENVEIRGKIALGAYLAGKALVNAGSGPSGAFSYPLGAVYKVPHGYAGAIFIPHITRINVEKGYLDYADLYDLIEGVDKNIPHEEKNKQFAEKIKDLMEKLGVPKSLSEYKLGAEDIEFMIEQTDVLKAAIDQNPIEITKEDVRQMMNQLA